MAVEQQARLGLSLAQSAEEAGRSPTEEDVDTAAQEFRYERDLVTAEEMEAWLERCDLTIEDWMDYVERFVLRRQERSEPFADIPDDAVTTGDIGGCVLTEAICSGELARFADTLAAHAAIVERAAAEGASAAASGRGEVEQLAARASRSLASSGLDLDADSCRERILELVGLEKRFECVSRQILTDSAIRAQIEAHRLDWIRLEVRDIGFSEEAAAKEAALCLREDGASFDSVAADAHAPVREGRYYLDEADPEARPMLLSARPDELVGPLAFPDGFHLLFVRGKIMPNEEDSEIRRRAEETLLARLSEQEAHSRVRWHERM